MAITFDPLVSPSPGAPYSPPRIDFSPIGNLLDSYVKGDQARSEVAVRGAFRNGIPKDASGMPNYGAMAETLARAGAPVGSFLPLANIGAQMGVQRENSRLFNGDPANGPRSDNGSGGGGYFDKTASQESDGNYRPAPNPNSSAAGKYQFTRGTQADVARTHPELGLPASGDMSPAQQEAAMRAFTADNATQLSSAGIQPTDRNLKMAHFLGAAGAKAFIAGLSANPNAPAYSLVSPQAAHANQSIFFGPDGSPKTAISVYRGLTSGQLDQVTEAAGGAAKPVQVASLGTPTSDTPSAPQGNSPPPIDPTRAPGGQSPTQAADAGASPQPGAPPATSGSPRRGPSAASALVPPAWVGREQQYANALMQQAGRMFQNKEAADSLRATAHEIFDALRADAMPTDAEKGMRSGTTGRAKEQELEITQGNKTFTGIQAQASQYERDLKPYLQLSRSIIDQPGMYSGLFAGGVLDYNRAKVLLGGDAKAAMLQEALTKVTATSVLGQINTQRDQLMEAGGASSRIFSSQVDLVEKAAPALTNTPAGNRFLIEVSQRMGELSVNVRQQAIDYVRTHGHLDPGFDQQIADYMHKHPVFNTNEMAHPEVLGAPQMPQPMDKQQTAAWARSLSVRPGDPIKTPTGRYVPAP